jgi:LmbE family N-acetylglucosaminyl deacetylase
MCAESISTPDNPFTLMAVFAHPDDESFGTGGTLARYADDPGVRVVLLCATRGEAGEISDPSLATKERLAEVREAELRCAAEMLGIDELLLLDYRDSGMAGTSENLDPRSLNMADFDEVVGQLVYQIRRVRPEVIVTFDPTGGYGHPDHVAIHYHTRAAFTAAADPCRYAEQLEAGLTAYQVPKLYYTAIPHRFFVAVAERMLELGIEVPERYLQRLDGPFGLPDGACTTDVDVRGYWNTKYAAVRCHATQLHPDSIFATLSPEIMRELQDWECFQLAASTVGGDEGSHDLFAGLR